MRAAIYARYSSVNQREASIEDQVRICKARALEDAFCPLAHSTIRANALEVSDGSAASAAFYSIATGRLDATSEAEARDSLFAYCARDTLALVKIHRAIRSLC